MNVTTDRDDATRPTDRRLIILLLVAVALTERALWAILRSDASAAGGEAFMVARAFANGRGIADAYQVGQGATAHLLPISPAIAGSIYALFGTGSVIANIVLSGWSIACAIGSYLLFYRAFGTLGMAAAPRLAAFAMVCVVPVYITQEAIDFRAWEGGLTMLLGAIFLDRAAIAHRDGLDWSRALTLVVVAAITFFVNPVYGIGLLGAGLVLAWRQWSIGRVALLGVVCVAALAVPIGPWAVRNARLLGHPVALRSNAGLELALANRTNAVDGRDQAVRYYEQLNTIHPHSSHVAYARMRAVGGEVIYSQRLGDEAKAWMAAHPLGVARLAVRHISQMFAPPSWAFSQLDGGLAGLVKSVLASMIGVLGLLGLAWRLKSGHATWLIAACLILVPALLVSPFQPIARYCYLIYTPAAFFTADLLHGAFMRWKARSGSRGFAPYDLM